MKKKGRAAPGGSSSGCEDTTKTEAATGAGIARSTATRWTALASFLADVHAVWEVATSKQRNKLAHSLFDEVWVKGKEVAAVNPRAELDPFFQLNYD